MLNGDTQKWMVFNGKLCEMDDLGIPLFRKCPSEEVASRFSGFLVASPCLWGKVVMSFLVAGVAFQDILTCLKKCRK